MVEPFHLARLPIIHFGKRKRELLPDLIKRYGSEIILVTGKRSFVDSPEAEKLFRTFKTKSIRYHHVTVTGEPSPSLIDDTVKRFNDQPVAATVAIGGGSVVDAGKAISAMLYKDDSVRDYLEVVGNREHPGSKVPFIAVPTTSGTGSEATKNAVISQVGIGGFKRSLRHDNLVPDIAVVDPELTMNCPPDITASAGMDCFTQLVEAYLSEKSGIMTDSFATEGIMAVKRSLVRSCSYGDDIGARSDMSFAALMSGICLANAGLGAVHGIAGTMGGMFGIPHGIICGTLMAAANEVNVKALRSSSGNHSALTKYASLGKIFCEEDDKSDEWYIDAFLNRLNEMTIQLQLPGLGSYGLATEDITLICDTTDIKNNPVRLTPEDLAEIICRRM
ncbi:MAG: iron-containing alcohol dehydrogenase [Bacteroidales bacterium]|nr:iron-containing alcohol dehydrogenase [Bacteroidales bacterium]